MVRIRKLSIKRLVREWREALANKKDVHVVICGDEGDCTTMEWCINNIEKSIEISQDKKTKKDNEGKKEFYFQTRYDMYKLTITNNAGKLELSSEGPFNVMGLNNRGTYTELIKDKWYESLRLNT